MRPAGASLAGIAAVLVGAWAALAGYVGPYFGWHPTSGTAWDLNLQNGLLHLAPGAAGLVAGVGLLALRPAPGATRRGALAIPALLLLAAGAWLVIGPVAWPTFEAGPAFAPTISASRNLLDQAGASLAPGLALVGLAGMALKAAMVRPSVTERVEEPVPEPTAEVHPVA